MSRPAYLSECKGPLWIPSLWEEINNNDHLKYSNCYTYAFNYVDYGDSKLQPGEIHGTKYLENTCDEIIQKVKNDNHREDIIETTFDIELPNDRYKIALFIDPDENDRDTDDFDQDYHFYRQDCDGSWSHKPGTNDATNEDASGNIILNPEDSDRNYVEKCIRNNEEDCDEEHNYSEFCGYLSVPLNSLYGPVIRFIERSSDDDDNSNNNTR